MFNVHFLSAFEIGTDQDISGAHTHTGAYNNNFISLIFQYNVTKHHTAIKETGEHIWAKFYNLTEKRVRGKGKNTTEEGFYGFVQ